ncbi:hypothetical protein [Reichenbachiella versicolor]|uniref:hypothetical protein n=1 Tax=Reichenbachiella versicolor TaxID=1821036 RepID=UPI000D6E1922|nr:hypothetical protein [Reichenbachiella versicolor]
MKSIITTLLVLSALGAYSQDTGVKKHIISPQINFASIMQSYASIQLGLDYTTPKGYSFSVTAGKIFSSEFSDHNDTELDQNGGYQIRGDITYDGLRLDEDTYFYVGVGYVHTESSFYSEYILKRYYEEEKYYQNVEQDYEVVIDQLQFKFGLLVHMVPDAMYFKAGINIGPKWKRMTPEPDKSLGVAVTNARIAEDFESLPRMISLDLKLGLYLFRL